MRENHWAMIKDGMVVNAILWDGVTDIGLGPEFTFVDISDDEFFQVSIGWKYENGKFIAPDPEPQPEPTKQELIAAADAQKNRKISNANAVFLEWQTRLLLNMANDEQKSAVTDWVNYIDAVRSVNTSTAPDINWPDEPAVPTA